MSAKIDTTMLKHLENMCDQLEAALKDGRPWQYDRLDAARYELTLATES